MGPDPLVLHNLWPIARQSRTQAPSTRRPKSGRRTSTRVHVVRRSLCAAVFGWYLASPVAAVGTARRPIKAARPFAASARAVEHVKESLCGWNSSLPRATNSLEEPLEFPAASPREAISNYCSNSKNRISNRPIFKTFPVIFPASRENRVLLGRRLFHTLVDSMGKGGRGVAMDVQRPTRRARHRRRWWAQRDGRRDQIETPRPPLPTLRAPEVTPPPVPAAATQADAASG
jgi:hypothetical protein